MSTFHIRSDALSEDADFILEAFDAALPHLASIGSGSQWGSTPRSTIDRHVNSVRGAVEKARSGTSNTDALFVAEVPVDSPVAGRTRTDDSGQHMLKVGAAIVQGSFASYVAELEQLDARVRADMESADYVYLYLMISDYRAGALRKGVGAALVQRVTQYAVEKKKSVIYVDCWAGNGEKLVGFYKSQGYVPVVDFQVKKPDGSVWPGCLLRMDIDHSIGETQ